MEFTTFNPITIDFNVAYLEWELSETIEDLSEYIFNVYRGTAQNDLGLIEVLDSNTYLYTDTTISGLQYNKHFNLYYQVEAFHLTDQTKNISSEVKSLNEPPLNWVAKEIIRRDIIGLQNVMGQQFVFLKRRETGTQCSCWDVTLGQKSTVGPCYICYDTNWIGGYYNPVTIYGSLGPWGESNVITPQGDQKDSATMFITTYYPKLSVNDVLIDTSGHRWRIVNLGTSRLNTAKVKQLLQVTIIDRDDPVYKLPYREGLIPNVHMMVVNTSSGWTVVGNSYILEDKQFGLESDTMKLKVGNGTSTWNQLSYFVSGGQFILTYTTTGRFVIGTLIGDINSINTVYTTPQNFILGSTRIHVNGVKQRLGYEYTETNSNTITFTDPPQNEGILDKLDIEYAIA